MEIINFLVRVNILEGTLSYKEKDNHFIISHRVTTHTKDGRSLDVIMSVETDKLPTSIEEFLNRLMPKFSLRENLEEDFLLLEKQKEQLYKILDKDLIWKDMTINLKELISENSYLEGLSDRKNSLLKLLDEAIKDENFEEASLIKKKLENLEKELEV